MTDQPISPSPTVARGGDIIRSLLANGVELPSKVIFERCAAEGLCAHHVRKAADRLGVVFRTSRQIRDGRSAFGPVLWSLPPTAPVVARPTPPPAPPSPPPDMDPEARRQCFRWRGRWTHPLGDAEYARLCSGGKPLKTPSHEPWLRRRNR